MTNHDEIWSIGELAKIAGVSERTLRHYDEIRLLKPRDHGNNGYRYYGREEAERLQEILFYRQFDIPLCEIKEILAEAQPRQKRLEDIQKRLQAKQIHLTELLQTIENSIQNMKGNFVMKTEDLYKPLSSEKQAEYEKWLEDQGISTQNTPRSKGAALEAKLTELARLEAKLRDHYLNDTDPNETFIAHQKWVGEMWGYECSNEAYAGLAQIYRAHPDFVQRFETIEKGMGEWLPHAMEDWAKNHE